MTQWEKRWALSVFEAIYPSGTEQFPIGAKEVPMARFIEDFFKHTSFQSRWGLRLALIVFQILPFLFIKRFHLFHRLSSTEKQEYLERWYHHRFYLFRQVALLFKMVASLGFCGFPEVQDAIGYVKPNREPPV